jgi:citrate synthase
MLADVMAGATPAAALAAAVRDAGRGVPGFGQPLYAATDARAAALLPLIAALDGAPPVLAAVDAVAAEVERRAGLFPNVDLALGALTLAAGLRPDAGVAIFALGRLVGWVAHALDEYEQRPLRLRPRGRYVGPAAR